MSCLTDIPAFSIYKFI